MSSLSELKNIFFEMISFNKKYNNNFFILIFIISYFSFKFFLKIFLGEKIKDKIIFYLKTDKIILRAYLPNGDIIFYRLSDAGIINELYEMGVYKGVKIKKGDIILDLGGHIGLFSLLASRLVGERGKIFSFEPSKESYELFKKNLMINKIKNVEVYNYAIYKKKGKLRLYLHKYPAADSILNKSKNFIYVKSISLKEFIKKKNLKKIDLIKFDIEGSEYDVIKNSKEIIKKAGSVVIEFHEKIITKEQIREIKQIFKRNKFKPKLLHPKEPLIVYYTRR